MNTEPTTLAAPPGPVTIQQWGELEGPPFYELVNGYLQERPEMAAWHDVLMFNLAALLIPHIKQRRLGQLAGSATPLRTGTFQGRKPDLFIVPPDQYDRVGKNVVHGVPSFVAEILSPTAEHIDRSDKSDEYAQLGVGEYWLIDFPNRTIEIHRLRDHSDGGRTYELAEMVKGDGVFRPSLFPGLEIPLAEVWPTEFENLTEE